MLHAVNAGVMETMVLISRLSLKVPSCSRSPLFLSWAWSWSVAGPVLKSHYRLLWTVSNK